MVKDSVLQNSLEIRCLQQQEFRTALGSSKSQNSLGNMYEKHQVFGATNQDG